MGFVFITSITHAHTFLMKCLLSLFIILVLPFIFFSCAGLKSSNTYRVRVNHHNIEIDTLDIKYDGHIYVKTSIGADTTKYWFLFDTGAGMSVIDEALVEKYKFSEIEREFHVTDAHQQKRHTPILKVPKVKIGKVGFEGFIFVKAKRMTSKCRDKKDYGIIGADIISQMNWLIDYKEEKLYMIRKENFSLQGDEIFTLPISYKGSNRSMLVKLKINGMDVEDITFDTGSGGGLTLPMDIYEEDKLIFKKDFQVEIVGESSEAFFGNVNNETILTVAEELRLGDLCMEVMPLNFKRRSGKMLGNRLLQYYKVYLDYRAEQINLINNVEVSGERKAGYEIGYGFDLKCTKEKGVAIAWLIKDSLAEEAGVSYNDEIVSINNETFMGGECEFYAWKEKHLKSTEGLDLDIKGKGIVNVQYMGRVEYEF